MSRATAGGTWVKHSGGWHRRILSWIRFGVPLRSKLILLVLLIVVPVAVALSWFSFASLRESIASIYEQRARSVAAVISKSIQEKNYILYYSDELDADIATLLERYESIVEITVAGVSARGFLFVASTDPSLVGQLVGEDEAAGFDGLLEVSVTRGDVGGLRTLRAYHPIYAEADLVGVIRLDMSLAEQAASIRQLSWRLGAASIVGFLVLAGLLALVLRSIVTRPVTRLATAMQRVARRRYDVEVPLPEGRKPGAPVRDEVAQLVGGFNRMTRLIQAHENELQRMVVLDEVTGAYNLDHFCDHMTRELGKGKRYEHPTSLIVVDVEGIAAKEQAEKDGVLVRTAGFLVSSIRNVDVIFRTSAYRFVALLPETPPDGAEVAASRLRDASPDVTAHVEFPVSLRFTPVGWRASDAPSIEEILERVTDRPSDPDG